jgi:hypothetical protein
MFYCGRGEKHGLVGKKKYEHVAEKYHYNQILNEIYLGGIVDTMAAPYFYMIMLYFKPIVQHFDVCNITIILLHTCFFIIYVVVIYILKQRWI